MLSNKKFHNVDIAICPLVYKVHRYWSHVFTTSHGAHTKIFCQYIQKPFREIEREENIALATAKLFALHTST